MPVRALIGDLRAALWAWGALHDVRRQLRGARLSDVRLPSAPLSSRGGGRAVVAVLRRQRATCLERALVRQRWLAGQGISRDVVIGVGPPSSNFVAHAWIDGEEDATAVGFPELTRLSP